MKTEDDPGTDWGRLLKGAAGAGGLVLIVLYLGLDKGDRQGFVRLVPEPPDPGGAAVEGESEGVSTAGITGSGTTGKQVQVLASLLNENQKKCLRIKDRIRNCPDPAVAAPESAEEDDPGDPLQDYGSDVLDYGESADRYLNAGEPKPARSKSRKSGKSGCRDQINREIESSWEVIESLRRSERDLSGAVPAPLYSVLQEMLHAHEEVCMLAADPGGQLARGELEAHEERYDRAASELRELLPGPDPYLGGQQREAALRDLRPPSGDETSFSDEEYRRRLERYREWEEEKEIRRQDELRREEERRKWQEERLERSRSRELPKAKLAAEPPPAKPKG